MVSPQDSSYKNPARANAAGNGRRFLAPPRFFPHCSFHTFLHGTAQGGTDQTAWAEHLLETDPFPGLRFITLGSALCRYNYRLLVPGVLRLLKVSCACHHHPALHRNHTHD